MSSPASLVVIQFTDVNGDLQTLQCDFDSIDYGGARAFEEEPTFCAVNKTPGNRSISISGTGFWNYGAGKSHTVLYPLWSDTTSRLYKYGPAGSGTGSILLSGLSFLTDYHVIQAAGGGSKISFKFEVDGNDYASTW